MTDSRGIPENLQTMEEYKADWLAERGWAPGHIEWEQNGVDHWRLMHFDLDRDTSYSVFLQYGIWYVNDRFSGGVTRAVGQASSREQVEAIVQSDSRRLKNGWHPRRITVERWV